MIKILYIILLFALLLSGVNLYSQRERTFINIRQINSINDDYLPFLVDSSLFFTSTRRNTREGHTLEFSEKVYYSLKKNGKWCDAKKMGYKWNSDNNTALVGVSHDYYFFYRSYWRNNGEIFSAIRMPYDTIECKAFKLNKLTKICTSFDELSATANIGDTIFFVSNRNGSYDIFMQTDDKDPVSLDSLNSEFDEQDVFLSPDSKSVFFSSNRTGGNGGFDIYKSDKINDHFSIPSLLQIKNVNSEADDRDFRSYNDSTMFFSSDREGGQGGFDIYMFSYPMSDSVKLKIDSASGADTVNKVVAKIKQESQAKSLTKTKEDSIIKEPLTIKTNFKESSVVFDTLKEKRDELIAQLKELGLIPFKGEVQLGAYRFIKNPDLFRKKFSCVNNESIRLDMQKVDTVTIYKFIINKLYTDIDSALEKQYKIINFHCFPEQNFSDMPFIALIDENRNRYAIFWKKDEFVNKKVFYIFQNGKQIWKTKRF
jgi:hypothetical protein